MSSLNVVGLELRQEIIHVDVSHCKRNAAAAVVAVAWSYKCITHCAPVSIPSLTRSASPACSAALAARHVRRPHVCPLSIRTHQAFLHHLMCLFNTSCSSCTEFVSFCNAFSLLLSVYFPRPPGPELFFLLHIMRLLVNSLPLAVTSLLPLSLFTFLILLKLSFRNASVRRGLHFLCLSPRLVCVIRSRLLQLFLFAETHLRALHALRTLLLSCVLPFCSCSSLCPCCRLCSGSSPLPCLLA